LRVEASQIVRRAIAPRICPQRLLLVRGAPSSRHVALTFDDGPDWMTERYLALLDRLRVRATFFLIGKLAAAQPELTRLYLRSGHEVLSHGYTHRRFPLLTFAGLRDELTRTEALLPQVERRFVRPPKGALDARSGAALLYLGYTPVMWSIDSMDHRVTDPVELVDTLRRKDVGGGEILLLHEGQEWTLSALPEIVAHLRARGLSPVTLSELLEAG
jgi:peptidoglycan/xylan/chitin deacetylase (PgdA/CDA1 family)